MPPVSTISGNSDNINFKDFFEIFNGDIFNFLQKVIQYDEEKIEETAISNGKNLNTDKSIFIASINAKYQAIQSSAELLNELINVEIAKANAKGEAIQKNIVELDKILDESNDASLASQFKKDIEYYKEKLRSHLESAYQDNFVKYYQEKLKDRLDEESNAFNERKLFFEDLIAKFKDLLGSLFKSVKDRAEEAVIEPESPEIIEINKTNKKKQRKRDTKTEKIFYTYSDAFGLFNKTVKDLRTVFADLQEELSNLSFLILRTVRKDTLVVPSRTYVGIYFILFLVVISGEFYLISELTRKVFKITQPNLLDFSQPLWLNWNDIISFKILSAFLFCISLPLAIGMIFKYRLMSYDQELPSETKRKRRRLFNFLFWAALIFSFSTAVLNGMELANVNHKFWKGLFLSISLMGLTIIFAAVGGIVFLEFLEAYEKYVNAKKQGLFSPRRKRRKNSFLVSLLRKDPSDKQKDEMDNSEDAYANDLRKEIHSREEKLKELNDERIKLRDRHAELTAFDKFNFSNSNWPEFISKLMEREINLYSHYFDFGRGEKLEQTNIENILDFLRKKRTNF